MTKIRFFQPEHALTQITFSINLSVELLLTY